jgi:phage/plasmid-like protein (TIGR03299 family)
MSHEISFANGQANFAFTGSRDAIWHGHGQALEQGASIEEWAEAGGFNWAAVETPVLFNNIITGKVEQSKEKKALYRSDNGSELAIVGKDFKVVQPMEVLEFFRDLVDGTGMYLDTAGQLFGGRRFFASANTQKAAYIGNKEDTVLGNLLLATALDGTMATNAGFFSTRVVCNNTLRFALAEEGKAKRVRVTHRQEFNPKLIKQNLGLIDNAWEKFIEDANKLASKKIDDATAKEIFADLVLVKNEDGKTTTQSQNRFELVCNLYKDGMGADMANGTLWGVLNAMTEFADHHNRVRSSESKAWEKFYGSINTLKNEAFDACMLLA